MVTVLLLLKSVRIGQMAIKSTNPADQAGLCSTVLRVFGVRFGIALGNASAFFIGQIDLFGGIAQHH